MQKTITLLQGYFSFLAARTPCPMASLLAHVSAFLCRSVIFVAAEVVDFRGRIRPHPRYQRDSGSWLALPSRTGWRRPRVVAAAGAGLTAGGATAGLEAGATGAATVGAGLAAAGVAAGRVAALPAAGATLVYVRLFRDSLRLITGLVCLPCTLTLFDCFLLGKRGRRRRQTACQYRRERCKQIPSSLPPPCFGLDRQYSASRCRACRSNEAVHF